MRKNFFLALLLWGFLQNPHKFVRYAGNTFKIVFLLIITSLFVQCKTVEKKKNDLSDIGTLGLEKSVYGLAFRAGPLPVGFLFSGGSSTELSTETINGVGLRGGQWDTYYSKQLIFGFGGGESFFSAELSKNEKGEILYLKKIPISTVERSNLKSYVVKYVDIFHDPPKDRQKRQKKAVQKYVFEKLSAGMDTTAFEPYLPKEDPKPKGYPDTYIYQFEIVLGVYGGLRLGFNLAELADFLTGMVGIDLLEDDMVESAEKR
jgi:hypothetical protein